MSSMYLITTFHLDRRVLRTFLKIKNNLTQLVVQKSLQSSEGYFVLLIVILSSCNATGDKALKTKDNN